MNYFISWVKSVKRFRGENKEVYVGFSVKKIITLLLCALAVLYAEYPDELEIDVTYFDYHSDGSNPDFNPSASNDGIIRGLVKDRLNSKGNPESTNKVYYSHDISRWFEPWEDNGVVPVYGWDGNSLSSTKTTNGRDTSFKNIKFEETITFDHVDKGIYKFSSNAFFPLDGRGFGNEKSANYDGTSFYYNHNYSFVMKLEKEFIYRKGLVFEFEGDDDVWVFINGKLALDIGGCHTAEKGSLNLDSKAAEFGLQSGKSYPLSFFFAERQADGSNCTITTNLISAPPNDLHIIVEPSNTIHVGDTADLSAYVDSDTGQVTDLEGKINWGVIDPLGKNGSSTLKATDALTAEFVPIKAHTTVKVWGSYKDPESGYLFTDTADITVLPGDMHHIVIEASPDKPDDGSDALWNDTPLNQVTIFEDDTIAEDFYVIARDKGNNWIGVVSDIESDNWETGDTYIASAANGSDSTNGEGKAIRGDSPSGGKTWARITVQDSLSDDIQVNVTPMYRIEAFPFPSPAIPDRKIETEIDLIQDIHGMAFLIEMVGIVGDFVKPVRIHANILDATGNLVVSLEMRGDEIPYSNDVDYIRDEQVVSGLAVFPWDCKNSIGRTVSNGAYVAEFTYEDNVGITTNFQVMLGVQKQKK